MSAIPTPAERPHVTVTRRTVRAIRFPMSLRAAGRVERAAAAQLVLGRSCRRRIVG